MEKYHGNKTPRDEEYVFAYRLTWSQTEAAEMCGVSRETIARAVRRAGIPLIGRKFNGDVTKQATLKITDAELIEACKTMTCNEIAQKYGMHRESLPRRFRRLSVRPVGYGDSIGGEYTKERIDALQEAARKWREAHPDESPVGQRIYGDCWHYVESHDKRIKQKYPNVVYLESRNGSNKQIRMKCKRCGEIFERPESSTRTSNITCDVCEKKKKEKQVITEERAKLVRFLYALKEYKVPKKCIYCGKEFYSANNKRVFCSDKCKKHSKGSGSIRKRCRKYGAYYDPTVTAIKIFKKDNYTCQICGRPCDMTDKRWGSFGPNYPTVDHIIALANGGNHVWGNVQCAHAICNSYKRDLITG